MHQIESKKVEEMSQIDPGNEDELPILVPKEAGEEAGATRKQGPISASVTAKETKKQSPKKDSEDLQSKKERAKAFNETSDTYNGAEMDNYKWSQTITELEIKVFLPEGTSGKNVCVDIRSDHLKVELLKPEYQVG